MLSDHSNNVCYNEDGTEVLAVVLAAVVLAAVVLVVVALGVALNDGRKVGHPVVVVGSPSCEALVVLADKNDEVVLEDSACNHRHNAGRNHLQRTLFLAFLL